MVERIDVSAPCNLEKTRSGSDVVTGSVHRMVSSRYRRLENSTLLQLLSAAVAVRALLCCPPLSTADAREYTRCKNFLGDWGGGGPCAPFNAHDEILYST